VKLQILGLAAALSAFAIGRARAEPEPLKPSDFAYGREIQVPDGASPVVSVALPLDVYRAMRSDQLNELMVFNGRGAQVPHATMTVRSSSPDAPETLELALFPLHGPTPRDGSATNLALEIERDSEGHVVRIAAKSAEVPRGKQSRALVPAKPPSAKPQADAAVDAGGPAAAPAALPQEPVAAYVLDARNAKRPVVSLRVRLVESADERVLPLRVEASEDLVRFTDIPVDGALVQLGHGGQRIDRDQIAIPPTQAAFYRLSPARSATFPAAVASVTATLADGEPAHAFEKAVVSALATDKPQVFDFDLGGPVPVDRLEFQLPENNTIVNAELFASSSRNGPWTHVLRTRLYRVARAEAEVTGPTLDVTRRHDRFYQLRVEPTGGGLGSGQPALVTYHAPDALLFLKRGEGPFTLAYGRYEVKPSRFEADDLLSLLPQKPAPTATGRLGESKLLGGPDRMTPPKAPPPYTTYAVWAILIAGVALLGGIAFRLARAGKPSA
jgi:Protein of unknown function (DUF3999)